MPELYEVNDRAVIAIIAHREIDVVTIEAAFDYNLVVRDGMTHYRTTTPAIALVDLIALPGSIGPQINAVFEALKLRVKHEIPFFLLPT